MRLQTHLFTILAGFIGLSIGLIALLVLAKQPPQAIIGINSFSTSVAKIAPSVVNIYTYKSNLSSLDSKAITNKATNLGSGVIIDKLGHILTNHHLVRDAETIIIVLHDGRQARAKLLGSDTATDLATLKIAIDKLPTPIIGNSHSLKPGDITLAIGNPFGLDQTVTMGIISALGRNSIGLNTYENFIQTDAAINPGNSGGALTNYKGELIGISTATYSSRQGAQGIGFAIPIEDALEVMSALIKEGEVVRGYLGIRTQKVTPDMAQILQLPTTKGLLISAVNMSSPAEDAGIKVGDIILSINNMKTTDPSKARHLIAALRPGHKINLIGIRGQQSFHTSINIAKQPDMGTVAY